MRCCLEAEDLNKLADQISGSPAAIVGINCDHNLNRARADVETNHVTWRSFSDGRDGPICSAWNVNSWPTTFVLDRKGMIRYRNVQDGRYHAFALIRARPRAFLERRLHPDEVQLVQFS